jgi:lysophospholipase L1-like esterase
LEGLNSQVDSVIMTMFQFFMHVLSKKNLFKFSGVVIGIIISLALAEVFSMLWINYGLKKHDIFAYSNLKLIDLSINQRWQRHAYLNYIPKPGYQINSPDSQTAATTHNSQGFRGKEFLQPKPAGVFRIVMIGGSAVYSSRVMYDYETIPARLEKSLKDRGYTNVEVINGGVSGHSTAEALINLQFRVFELSPDMVIVYEAINDLHNRYVPPELHHADNRGRIKPWQGEDFPLWAKSYFGRLVAYQMGFLKKRLFIDYYISAPTYLGHTASNSLTNGIDYKKLLAQNKPNFFKENLLSIYGMCKVRGISLLLSTYGYTLKSHEEGYLQTKEYQNGLLEMNQIIRNLAREQKIPLVDYAAEMSDHPSLWRDEVHVSNKGAVESGEIFAKSIIKYKLIHQ